jgi:hypothetical protein
LGKAVAVADRHDIRGFPRHPLLLEFHCILGPLTLMMSAALAWDDRWCITPISIGPSALMALSIV